MEDLVPIEKVMRSNPNGHAILENHRWTAKCLMVDRKPAVYRNLSRMKDGQTLERRSVYAVKEGRTPRIIATMDRRRGRTGRILGYEITGSFCL